MRPTGARCGCATTRCRSTTRRRARSPRSERTKEFEREIERRRRDHIILRVDRSDLSKNVLRGFTAFDQFLDEHPEFIENVTFIAQLMPSRMDVPEYQEYLERIEALVAIVNHRHGTPDWMPIQLKLRDDLEEAVAAYKHYDVMIVNAMFDGMNLVAKEGPLVNERNGVSILSENTGAHEELGEWALSVNPFDIKETADSIYRALTMSAEERARRVRGPEGRGHGARSGRLDRRAARRHQGQEHGDGRAVGGPGEAGRADPALRVISGSTLPDLSPSLAEFEGELGGSRGGVVGWGWRRGGPCRRGLGGGAGGALAWSVGVLAFAGRVRGGLWRGRRSVAARRAGGASLVRAGVCAAWRVVGVGGGVAVGGVAVGAGAMAGGGGADRREGGGLGGWERGFGGFAGGARR